MLIEIFEIKHRNISEGPDDMDERIMELFQRFGNKIKIKKINVFDKNKMKGHDNVKTVLDEEGIECLPIIKVDGKIIHETELEIFIEEKLG